MLKQSVQQNWRGYTENNPGYEYALWEIDFFVNNFQNRLLNEQAFSNEVRSLIRKTVIHLENPSYNFPDYTKLLDIILEQFQKARSKREKLKLLKQIHLIVAIIIKYCKEEGNLKHAIKCTEKYILKLWPILSLPEHGEAYLESYIHAYDLHLHMSLDYYHKLGYIGNIKDGFSRSASDSLSYTYTLYEQLGIISSCGLVLFQMYELSQAIGTMKQEILDSIKNKALEITETVIQILNNNNIVYNPRSDDHHIELNLVFILLFKSGKKADLINILALLNKQMGEGIVLSNVFPDFSNSKKLIAELEIDYDKRSVHEYQASNLFTILVEWTAICESEQLYKSYRIFKEKLLPEMNLLLWFPENETENLLYKANATHESGYALSGIKFPEDMKIFVDQIKEEFSNNCHEKEFSFIKQGMWSLGLIASRHYRTYIFPYYWRQFLI